MSEIRSRIDPLLLGSFFLLTGLTLWAFFPGQMSPDTINQLAQARMGSYHDMHQPIMAALWRGLLEFAWDNPGVLFTFHVLLYGSFFYGLALAAFPAGAGRWAVLLVAALPPLWSQVIVVWKDTELSLALLGFILFAILAERASRGPAGGLKPLRAIFVVLCLLACFYAAAVRENSLPAIFPLLALLVSSQVKRWKAVRVALAAILLSALNWAAVQVLDYGILHAERKHPYQVNAIFDIAGVYAGTGREDLIPDYWKKLNPQLTPRVLASRYDPHSVISIIAWGEPLIPLTKDPAFLAELRTKWREAVLQYPGAWLAHRWRVFRALMGVGMPQTYYPYHFGIDENGMGVRNEGNPRFQQAFRAYVVFFRDSLFFRGWVYLVLLGLLLGARWRKFPDAQIWADPAFTSALSGFLYGTGYFLYAPAADFRFLYPMVLLFFLSVLLWAFQERREAVERNEAFRGVL